MTDTSSFKLIIEDDEGRRSVVAIDLESEKDGISIGRQEGNIIRLNERNVSRRHARFVRETLGIFAEDLDSYNGVWVNGDRIKGRQELHDGDTVRVGDFQLELRGEGLQRRVEETTQRTMVNEGSEATHPDIRLAAQMNAPSPGLSPGLPPLAPGIPAGGSHADGARDLPSRTPTLDEDATGPEPTALVRVGEQSASADSGAQVVAGKAAKIICVSTQFAGGEHELDKAEVVIGRTDENDIAIDHRSVSRHHAKIVVNQRSYRIMDLKSANGTLVNGEEYAQTELKRGDLIELGHVKFRFVPPGGTYELTQDELQSIRAVNPNARRSTEVMRPGARGVPTVDSDVQNINMAPTAVNQWSDELALIQRRRRMKPLVVACAAAFGVIMIGGTIIYQMSKRNERSSLPNAVVVKDQGGEQSGNPQVNDMMTRATNALATKQWGEARKLSEAVLVLQPGYPQALEVQKRSTDEMLGQAAIDKAQESIDAHKWDDAWRQLGEVPEGTAAAASVPAKRNDVRAGQVAVKAADAREKIAAGKKTEASAVIGEIREIDPSSPEIGKLKSELEGGAIAVAEAHPAPVETAKPDKTKPDKNKPAKDTKATPAPAPTPPAPTPAPPAPVVAKTPPPPAPTPTPPPPAPVAAAPAADAKTYYSQGLQALQQQDTDKAIELLDKCVKADTKAGMCYRALGISYARLKNGPKAAKYYRMYLRVQPDAKDAAQVEQLLKAYENTSNP